MCTSPLPARRVNGQIEFLGRSKEHRFFNQSTATLQIPCGQCAECRLKRSREWAARCMNEASLHADNCFITLTYRDDLDAVNLDYSHFQSFLKRLRAAYPSTSIRFLAAGEYGETNPQTGIKDGGKYRAHFHALLFNFNFPDLKPARLIGDSDLFTSEQCDRLWRFGSSRIGKVTFESASYVARYSMKKVNGDLADAAYRLVLPDGEVLYRTPEMLVMSKRPAIGREWFEKYGKHAIHEDSVVMRGKSLNVPAYYLKLVPDVVKQMVVESRLEDINRYDQSDSRNNVRDTVVRAGLDQFKRS